jgi:hypothetical protein
MIWVIYVWIDAPLDTRIKVSSLKHYKMMTRNTNLENGREVLRFGVGFFEELTHQYVDEPKAEQRGKNNDSQRTVRHEAKIFMSTYVGICPR